MKSLVLATTATKMDKTPFLAGKNVTAIQIDVTAPVQLTGSDDGTNYTNLAVVPAAGMVNIPRLPKYVKGAATVWLLASA